jgi:hypothetical protein
MRPWRFVRDAILQHVASWGDRNPHEPETKHRGGFVKCEPCHAGGSLAVVLHDSRITGWAGTTVPVR